MSEEVNRPNAPDFVFVFLVITIGAPWVVRSLAAPRRLPVWFVLLIAVVLISFVGCRVADWLSAPPIEPK